MSTTHPYKDNYYPKTACIRKGDHKRDLPKKTSYLLSNAQSIQKIYFYISLAGNQPKLDWDIPSVCILIVTKRE